MSLVFERRDRVGSTNDEARQLAESGAPDGTVVIAREQTSGRGRRGRSWFSPDAGNVYMSYIHRSRLPPAQLAGLTLDAGTAVAEALEDTGVAAVTKWPNDLLVGDRKLAGILTELIVDGAAATVIVGVGVNVRRPASGWPSELADIAVSLQEATGLEHDADALAVSIAQRLKVSLAAYDVRGAPDRAAYERRMTGIGATARAADGRRGRVLGVAIDGALRIEIEGAEQRVVGGEVLLVGTGIEGRP